MSCVIYISNVIIPLTILCIILYGAYKKTDLYGSFVSGAKDGLLTVYNILPTLVGLLMAVSVLRASGALDFIVMLTRPLTGATGFPGEVIPLALMRLFSSSAASSMLVDLFREFGPDTFIGRVGSVMMSSTETVFYTLSLYFMSIGMKKTGYTLTGALIANIAGIIASYFIVAAFFGA